MVLPVATMENPYPQGSVQLPPFSGLAFLPFCISELLQREVVFRGSPAGVFLLLQVRAFAGGEGL